MAGAEEVVVVDGKGMSAKTPVVESVDSASDCSSSSSILLTQVTNNFFE